MNRHPLFFVRKMTFLHKHFCQWHWLCFAVGFGAFPLVLRIGLATAEAGENIPMFAISDIAFWGLILNTAAMAHINPDRLPKVYFLVAPFAVFLSGVMAAVYGITLVFPPGTALWALAVCGFLASFVLSFLTSVRPWMDSLQHVLDVADKLAVLPPALRRETVALFEKARERLEAGEEFDWKKEAEQMYAAYVARNE